jgi:hypothetical protein
VKKAKIDSEYKAAHEAGYTTFYARDRGENVTVEKFKDFADYRENHQYEEYEYILRQVDDRAVWYVATDGGDYTELETLLLKETA